MLNLTDASRPCISIDTNLDHPPKADPTHLYVHQRHTVEIIQLTEVAAPAPSRFPGSPVDSSSLASSSSSCFTTDEESESEYPTDEEPESICSSYCSSDDPEPNAASLRDDADAGKSRPDAAYDTRVTRVQAWRTRSASDMAFTVPVDAFSVMNPAKRKAADDREMDTDDVSLPKRSRGYSFHALDVRVLTTSHLCTACDASFPTRLNLRQHGEAPQASEACRIAVEYDFES